jgi:probable F420-dependent oxidoreductase
VKFILALNAIGTRTEELVPLAQAAEGAGFDGVMLGDHVVMAATIRAEASYTRDGKSPMGFETGWPECLSAMAFLLGATSRLRVISSVLVLPMRNPLIVAKSVQTMAIMSGGRVVLGVGSGWMAEEFAALGAPFAGRGARTGEAIQIIRRLGTEGTAEWRSAHYDIPRLSGYPTPERPVPIYVGGEAEPALRRAAHLGDGYLSVLRTRASPKKRLARLNELREAAGRADQPFEFIGVPADAHTPEDFAALQSDGIGACAVMAWQASYEKTDPPLGRKLEAVAAFGERVIRPLA